jgi:hypothetical protein
MGSGLRAHMHTVYIYIKWNHIYILQPVNEPTVRASFWRNPKAHIEPSCTAVEHIHNDLKPGQSPAIHTGQTLKAWNQVEQAVAFLLEAKFR